MYDQPQTGGESTAGGALLTREAQPSRICVETELQNPDPARAATVGQSFREHPDKIAFVEPLSLRIEQHRTHCAAQTERHEHDAMLSGTVARASMPTMV